MPRPRRKQTSSKGQTIKHAQAITLALLHQWGAVLTCLWARMQLSTMKLAEPSAKAQQVSATPTVENAVKELQKVEKNVQALADAPRRQAEF